MLLTVPKGATPVNQTSATDWQMAARWDVIIITLQVHNTIFLATCNYFLYTTLHQLGVFTENRNDYEYNYLYY